MPLDADHYLYMAQYWTKRAVGDHDCGAYNMMHDSLREAVARLKLALSMMEDE